MFSGPPSRPKRKRKVIPSTIFVEEIESSSKSECTGAALVDISLAGTSISSASDLDGVHQRDFIDAFITKPISRVYLKDDDLGWTPADLIHQEGSIARVIPRPFPRATPLKSNAISPSSHNKRKSKHGESNEGKEQRYNRPVDEILISGINISERKPKITHKYISGIPLNVNLTEYENHTLPLQDVNSDGILNTHEDMRDLPYLHESSILYNLKNRFEGRRGVPYTRAGEIIVSINPYRWIRGLYAEKTRHLYAHQYVWKPKKRSSSRHHSLLPPHVYETSSKAFKGLTTDGQDQSILVSGESGAGKTVSVKVLMSHLATFEQTKNKIYVKFASANERSRKSLTFQECKQTVKGYLKELFGKKDYTREVRDEFAEVDEEPKEMEQDSDIVQRVLECNPLLEAFGNAATTKNDNSSRFSKYVQLQFHVIHRGFFGSSCNLAGSLCATYLLEKTRVVKLSSGERNFHIFYQLLAAPDDVKSNIWPGLVGCSMSSFRILGLSERTEIEGYTDAQKWRRTIAALSLLGIQTDSMIELLRSVVIVLLLGNINFKEAPDSNDDGSIISNIDDLDHLSHLIEINADDLHQLLTARNINVMNKTICKRLTVKEAEAVRNALAKEIYDNIFHWLLQAINDATSAEDNYCFSEGQVDKFGVIGMLDIFGFETLDINYFEQLCINYSNEKLQHKFTRDVFRAVQEEYRDEGVYLEDISFDDNSNVIELIEGKLGLINLLNEECLRPRGTDEVFVNKLYKNNSSPLIKFRKYQKEDFGIQHYAGVVSYKATQFVAKNMDTLSYHVVQKLANCNNSIIRAQFKKRQVVGVITNGNNTSNGSSTFKGDTELTKFKRQLNALMKEIDSTKTHYVRCINPNPNKLAGVMDLKYTMDQLRSAGLIASLTMTRKAYPNKLKFQDILDRYTLLVKQDSLINSKLSRGGARTKDDVVIILDKLLQKMEITSPDGNVAKAYVFGNNKVYFQAGALEDLEAQRLSLYDTSAIIIQRNFRKSLMADKKISAEVDSDDDSSSEDCCMCMRMLNLMNDPYEARIAEPSTWVKTPLETQWYI